MARVWQRVRDRSVVVAVAAALAVASCGPQPAGGAADADGAATAKEYHSALGDYLAARLAHADGDIKASAQYYADALAFDPDNTDIMQRAFTLMVVEGRVGAALPMAERLVELDSDSPVPHMVLGVEDARAGDFAKARAQFAALPKRGINAFLGPLLTAWAEVGEGHTDDALKSLTPLTANTALVPLHAFHTGLIDDLAGRSAAAAQQYDIALTAGPLNIRAVEAAGSLDQRTGHSDQARELYDRYKAEHPETMLFDGDALLKAGAAVPRPVADARGGMAEVMFDVATLMRQGNAPDYAMLFSRLAVALQPDFPLAQMTIADILASQGRLAEANAVYRAISTTSPVYDFGELRVAANLDESGDTAGALAELDKLAALRPTGLDALVTKGDVLRRHKRYVEAAEAYGKAIARLDGERPEDWALYYSRGVCWERADRWPEAEADLTKALKLQPDQPDVLNYLGYSWIVKGMHLDEARKMIERAVELRPDDGAIVDSLGWALYHLGHYRQAVTTLEHAVELKGDDPTINEHLGDAYWQAGRKDEARYQWRRCLDLDPEPDQVKGLKERVDTGALPADSPAP